MTLGMVFCRQGYGWPKKTPGPPMQNTKYKGLWDIVNGSTPALAPTDAWGHLEWTQCDQEAQLQIMSALNSSPLNHVLNAKTGKEV